MVSKESSMVHPEFDRVGNLSVSKTRGAASWGVSCIIVADRRIVMTSLGDSSLRNRRYFTPSSPQIVKIDSSLDSFPS
jgi:hypothetical protein